MLALKFAPPSSFELARLIRNWEPPKKPHCSNCLFARVSGDPENPTVECAAGHGKTLTLGMMLRNKAARQFRPAVSCPDWSSMDDEP